MKIYRDKTTFEMVCEFENGKKVISHSIAGLTKKLIDDHKCTLQDVQLAMFTTAKQ